MLSAPATCRRNPPCSAHLTVSRIHLASLQSSTSPPGLTNDVSSSYLRCSTLEARVSNVKTREHVVPSVRRTGGLRDGLDELSEHPQDVNVFVLQCMSTEAQHAWASHPERSPARCLVIELWAAECDTMAAEELGPACDDERKAMALANHLLRVPPPPVLCWLKLAHCQVVVATNPLSKNDDSTNMNESVIVS
eukprot:765326-Hanusia_phi.AAC.3